jgi:hypothetical protein
MELGRTWPFPREWGIPAHIPPEVLDSAAAADRFLSAWAAGKIRQQQRRRPGRRLSGCEALEQLETRIRNENRLRIVEVLAKAHPPG